MNSAPSRWAWQLWTPGHCSPLPCWTAAAAAAATAVHLDPTLLPPLSPSRQTPQVVSTCTLGGRENPASERPSSIESGLEPNSPISSVKTGQPLPSARALPAKARSLASGLVLVPLCPLSWSSLKPCLPPLGLRSQGGMSALLGNRLWYGPQAPKWGSVLGETVICLLSPRHPVS